MAKILIADDDRAVRTLIAESLRCDGYTIFEASDGIQALELALKENPDVVLSDWTMPHLEGVEFCRKLKADAQNLWTYFILVTARTGSEDRIRGLDAGADDILSKPIMTDELRARVRTGLRVQSMHSKLVAQNTVLSKLNRFKSDMLAFASHEIKTPLAVLRISLEMLRMDIDNAESLAENLELLDTAEQQAIQLSELISTLLDLRKLEEGRMEFNLQPIDIRELIDKVIEQITPLVRLKRQYIGVNHANALVLADREKLQQVLLNLLSNACKYSPEDSRILVQTHRGPSDILIGIIDEGPGITEDKQPLLFRRYAQLQGEDQTSDDRFKGTGLGLVLCQEFIHGMGGNIGVHSKPNRGSCFWVQVPQYKPEDAIGMISCAHA